MADNGAMADTAIADLLRGEGFQATAALAAGRRALEEAGLTRPGKVRIADEKLDRARDAIGRALVRHCSDPACIAAVADDGRELVEVERAHCSVCSGSNNTRALRRMELVCTAAGIRRVLVVGGRPPMYAEIEAIVGRAFDLRFVDGTSTLPNGADALRDCWAGLASSGRRTPLPPWVRQPLPRAEVCGVAHRVTVHRRGIEALAVTVVEHFS